MTTPSLGAISSIDTFDKLYMNLSQCCVDYFAQSSRVRTAAKVVYNMGLLYFERGNYPQAIKYFKRSAKVYGKEGWSTLEYPVREIIFECQQRLGLLQDTAETCLHLMSPDGPAASDGTFMQCFACLLSFSPVRDVLLRGPSLPSCYKLMAL